MKNYFKFFILSLIGVSLLMSCKREYGYNFEDGVDNGLPESNNKLDTNMNFVDRSLFNRARVFPGTVGASETRLMDHEITLDLNYVPARELRVSVSPQGIHSTGLYAATGELVKIIVPAGIDGLTVQIGVHTDNLSGKLDLQRDPIVYTMKALFPGVNYIRSLYGGLIWIRSRSPIASPFKLTFSNVVEAPNFVLGKSSNTEWFAKLKSSTVPWLELQSKHTVFTLSKDMVNRFISNGKLTDPTKLMSEWDRIYEFDYYNWMGLTVGNTDEKHRAPDLPERGVLDIQISVGYGHNGYPWMGILDESWAGSWIDYEDITNGGGWGTWHEVGHNYQQGNWSWEGLGETTNNLFIFKTADRLNTFPKHPALNEQFPLALAFAAKDGIKDFDKNDNPFFKLMPFLQLFDNIKNPKTGMDGWGLMAELYTRTRNAKRLSNNIQDRKDFFYEAVCDYAQIDFLRFMVAWGINISPQTQKVIATKNYPKIKTELWKYDPRTETGGNTAVPTRFEYPKGSWKVLGFSTEETAEGAAPAGRAIGAIDGNINTYWHSQWSGASPAPPHHLIFDMADQLEVKGFQFYLRQNSQNGRPKNIQILTSSDNITWKNQGTFPMQNIITAQEVKLNNLSTFRYVRLNFNDLDVTGAVYATLAEFGVFYDE